ncbi:hypothetical protein IFM89_019824 [Coptis chinensis]|uniref:Uncharacterized protein n=1 Tax=Coptis chinensis TaxID=261450 RepID=A0A835M8L7_9MAGN|nr:hypothetical protein IFM89_019824 [Coptis chinensis]
MAIDPSNEGGATEEKRDVSSVKVPAKDPKKKDDKNNNEDDDLSDEDLALKQQLELYVERVQDCNPGIQKIALESMRCGVVKNGRIIVGIGFDCLKI